MIYDIDVKDLQEDDYIVVTRRIQKIEKFVRYTELTFDDGRTVIVDNDVVVTASSHPIRKLD